MDRIILHIDMNNFYASVACRDNPELCGKAVAVCGSVEMRHGIVLAKNMKAKAAGVKTGEAIWQAKEKCPELITVSPDFPRYSYFSALAKEIYSDYSDLIEPFGLDEVWMDVTGSCLIFGSGERIAEEIRRRIKAELGLTVSIGVSFNKVFAKLGSDLKKPDAVTVINKESFREKIWGLPIESMIGIGASTKKKLHSVGIYKLGELAAARDGLLDFILGVRGPELKKFALGEDQSPVSNISFKRTPQSISRSLTYRRDFSTDKEVWRLLLELSDEVASELRQEGLAATGVGIHIKNSALKVTELQAPLEIPSQVGLGLAKEGFRLFKRNYDMIRPLRAIGIRAIKLIPYCGEEGQLYLFEDVKSRETLQKIENKMDDIRGRFGKDAIVRGRILCTL